MASELEAAFARAKEAGRPAFIPYVTGGFPTKDCTVQVLLDLEAGGADVIEVGVPFSDPLADGTTIQRANQVALNAGITINDCFAFVREARERGLTAPVVLMGYYNPFLAFGEESLATAARDAGVQGFIVVDLPPEEAGPFLAACDKHSLGFIPLVAPTTLDSRLERLVQCARGYLYCVSITGITGTRSALPDDLAAFVGRVRAAAGAIPLAVGFGLSERSHVDAVGAFADGAVMGSALIRHLEANGPHGVREWVQSVSPTPKA